MKKGNRIIIVATLPDYEDDAGDHTLEDVATYLTSSGVTLKDATIYGDAEESGQGSQRGQRERVVRVSEEACGLYAVKRGGTLQILGYSIEAPDTVTDITNRAWGAAWEAAARG